MRAFPESDFFSGKGEKLPSMAHIKTVYDAVKFSIGFKNPLLCFLELRSTVKEEKAIDAVIEEE